MFCVLGMQVWLMQVRTVARIDNLAQASLSRLGETNRGSPKLPTREVA